MKTINILVLFCVFNYGMSQNLQINKRHLGMINNEGYYAFDGGMLRLDYRIIQMKINNRKNTIKIYGKVFSEYDGEQKCENNIFEKKIFNSVLSSTYYFDGVHDTLNRKILITYKKMLNFCGEFKLEKNFKNEAIFYFAEEGFSVLEIKISAVKTSQKGRQKSK